MVVGVLELRLAVPAFTLKEKRSVVKRILHRTRNRFNVSGAEVGDLDVAGAAQLGFVSVSNDRRYLEGQMMKVERFVDDLEVAEITDSELTIETY